MAKQRRHKRVSKKGKPFKAGSIIRKLSNPKDFSGRKSIPARLVERRSKDDPSKIVLFREEGELKALVIPRGKFVNSDMYKRQDGTFRNRTTGDVQNSIGSKRVLTKEPTFKHFYASQVKRKRR